MHVLEAVISLLLEVIKRESGEAAYARAVLAIAEAREADENDATETEVDE